MQRKKVIGFSIVIGIFLIIFGIVYLIDGKRESFDYQNIIPEEIPYDMQEVLEYSYFFSVVNILNKYLNSIKEQDTEVLLNVLHEDYLNLYNINKNNLYSNIGDFSNLLQVSFKVKNMDYKKYDNKYIYYVKGDVIANLFEENEIIQNDAMFLVNIDYDNTCYAIYPLNGIDEFPIKEPLNVIIPNKDNELIGSNIITKDYICNLYLNDFIENINNNIEYSYDLLSDDFRKKQYPDKEKFITYLNDNKNKLSSQVYSCNSLSGRKRIYEIKDMNFNTYTITEESIMNYRVEFSIN